MTRHPEVEAVVAELVGTWAGHGEGEYPTLAPFRYRETTEISARPDHPALLIDQRTWRSTTDGEDVSHWETGLLRISSDGSVRLHDAQPGRTETMSGTWRKKEDGWVMTLSSTGFAGDDRVVRSTRTIHLTPGKLVYEMRMETTSNRDLAVHLRARLERTATG